MDRERRYCIDVPGNVLEGGCLCESQIPSLHLSKSPWYLSFLIGYRHYEPYASLLYQAHS